MTTNKIRKTLGGAIVLVCTALAVGCRCGNPSSPAAGASDAAERQQAEKGLAGSQAESGESRDGAEDLARVPGELDVVVDERVRRDEAYHLGDNWERYVRTHKVLIRAYNLPDGGIRYDYTLATVDAGGERVELTLDPQSHRAFCSVSTGGKGLPKAQWDDVYGVLMIDQWPANAKDPVYVRFLVCGTLTGTIRYLTDLFETRRPKSKKATGPFDFPRRK